MDTGLQESSSEMRADLVLGANWQSKKITELKPPPENIHQSDAKSLVQEATQAISSLRNWVVIAGLIVFVGSGRAAWSASSTESELPFAQALTHLDPAAMDTTLDQVLQLVRESCSRDLSKIRADLVPLYTETLIYQLSIQKSFKSFLRLVNMWNGHQDNSNFHLYVYPKILAYLEANTLFGVSLAYYNHIDCITGGGTDLRRRAKVSSL